MSKKQLNTEGVINELKGGSVFFQKQEDEKIVRPVREERPVPSERHVYPPARRERKRHPFDIYRDQYETLLRLKSAYMMETGELKSMSEMVREALDNYLQLKQNRT